MMQLMQLKVPAVAVVDTMVERLGRFVAHQVLVVVVVPVTLAILCLLQKLCIVTTVKRLQTIRQKLKPQLVMKKDQLKTAPKKVMAMPK